MIFQITKNKLIQQFDLNSTNIKDFFDNKVFLNIILNKLIGNSNLNLDNKIYIKNNKVAIFTVWGYYWSNTYRAKVINNQVRIELLQQIIE